MFSDVLNTIHDALRYLVDDIGATTVGILALCGALWVARKDRQSQDEQKRLDDLRDSFGKAAHEMIEKAQEATIEMIAAALDGDPSESYETARNAYRTMNQHYAAIVIRVGREHPTATSYAAVRDHLWAFAPASDVQQYYPDSPVPGWKTLDEVDAAGSIHDELEDTFLDHVSRLLGAAPGPAAKPLPHPAVDTDSAAAVD